MRESINILVCLSLGVAACATTKVSKYPDLELTVLGEATGVDLETSLYDEASDLAMAEFRSDDGVLAGRALAAGVASVTKTDSGYDVEVPLGAGASAAKCLVQEGVLGMSAFARSLVETYLFSYKAHELKYVYAGARNELPLLAVHGQYIDRGAGGGARRTGFFKLVVAGRSEVTVACVHDQFGYRDTLERVARSIARSAEWSRPRPLLPLIARSVYKIDKGGQASGAREWVIRADDEDFRRSWVRTAFLSMRGQQRLYARDILETFESDPDGLVIAQTYQAREDGALRVELNLDEGPMPDYRVAGRIGDESAGANFGVDDGLPDPLLVAQWRREGRSFARYAPEVEALAPTQCAVESDGKMVRVELGPQVVTGTLDDAGFWLEGTRGDGYRFRRVAFERP